MTLIGFAYCSWQHCNLRQRCQRCCVLCADLEKKDVNDIYGTYARGYDGEGEYGDGDKVYVTDTNSEYNTYDYMESDLDTTIRDNNSHYSNS